MWIRAVAATYGFEPCALLLQQDDGLPLGGIAYVELDDPRGRRLTSFPFADYADPLLGDGATWSALVDPLLERDLPFSMRVLRSEAPLKDPRLAHAGTVRWHQTVIEGGDEAQWQALRGSARRNVRKAQESGVGISRSDGIEALRSFYELHAGVRKRKYGLLPQPWSFFEALHAEFAPDNVQVLLAHHSGRVIAGIVFFVWRDTLYYKFNASDLGELRVRPNDLLAWEGLSLARDLGLRAFDWGVSDEDQPGLIRYKQKFATEERQVTTLRHQPLGSMPGPEARRFGSLLGELTGLLTDERVPDDVTQRAGSLLYRYFA